VDKNPLFCSTLLWCFSDAILTLFWRYSDATLTLLWRYSDASLTLLWRYSALEFAGVKNCTDSVHKFSRAFLLCYESVQFFWRLQKKWQRYHPIAVRLCTPTILDFKYLDFLNPRWKIILSAIFQGATQPARLPLSSKAQFPSFRDVLKLLGLDQNCQFLLTTTTS
jgi:hypothetical protein